VFLHRRPGHGDEDGHVEQIGDSVRPGCNGTGLGAERDFPLQDFGAVQRIRAALKFINADSHARGEIIREPQQRLLHFHRVHGVLIFFARRDSADGLTGNIRGALDEPAACAEGEEQEAQKK
jgi:hypothetical protein